MGYTTHMLRGGLQGNETLSHRPIVYNKSMRYENYIILHDMKFS